MADGTDPSLAAKVEAPCSRSDEPSSFLPPSGRAIGEVIKVLGLSSASEALRSSTARRYFQGKRVRPESRARVLRAVVDAMESELGWPTKERRTSSSSALIASSVAWDEARSVSSSVSTLLHSSHGPWEIPAFIVRGFVVSHAVRVLDGVGDLPTPRRGGRGIGGLLRDVMEDGRLTRERLVEALRCSRNTVDDWLDKGTLPRAGTLYEVAEILSKHTGRATELVARELRWECVRARIRRLVEAFRAE